MTTPPEEQRAAAPSTGAGDPAPASPRRAAVLTELAADVRALRTETRKELTRIATTVGDNADLLAQALPRVDGLDELVAAIGTKLDATAEKVTALEKAAEDEGPTDWPALSSEDAAAEWEALATWVAQILGPFYEIRRGQLPDCWALHRPVVIELVWLRRTYVTAHLPKALPGARAEWHTRWRRDALANIAAAISTDWCRPGEHLVHKNQREQDRYQQAPGAWSPPAAPHGAPPAGRPESWTPGGQQSTPPVPARSIPLQAPEQEITTSECWQSQYEMGSAEDLAWRRQREAEEEADEPDDE